MSSLIAQGSTERGTAIVVDEEDADRAVEALVQEFHHDLEAGHVTKIYAEKGLAVVAIIGLNLLEFDRPYRALVRQPHPAYPPQQLGAGEYPLPPGT